MKECDQQYIGKLIPKLQRFEIAALCRYYSKLPRDLQVDVHRVQTDIMRTRSQERIAEKHGEYAYATFLQAIAQVRSLERASDARQALHAHNAQRTNELRRGRVTARKEKAAPTRRAITKKYLTLINQLQEQRYSWRQISEYIKRYHHQSFSHSYLRKIWLECQDK